MLCDTFSYQCFFHGTRVNDNLARRKLFTGHANISKTTRNQLRKVASGKMAAFETELSVKLELFIQMFDLGDF